MKLYCSIQHVEGNEPCHFWDRTKRDAEATRHAMAEEMAAEGQAGHVVTWSYDYPLNQRALIELGNGHGVQFVLDHGDVPREMIHKIDVEGDDDEEIEVELEEED